MRVFLSIVGLFGVCGGFLAVYDGNPAGWLPILFFGFLLYVALFFRSGKADDPSEADTQPIIIRTEEGEFVLNPIKSAHFGEQHDLPPGYRGAFADTSESYRDLKAEMDAEAFKRHYYGKFNHSDELN